MNWLNDIIGVINNYLWSYVLIVMLIGIGLWFTVRTRFVQIRCIPEMFRLMTEGAGAKPREGHISTFQAFCVSTASRVGVGNIAGIAILRRSFTRAIGSRSRARSSVIPRRFAAHAPKARATCASSPAAATAGAGASPRLRSSLQPACVRHGKCRKGALADNLRANPLLQW